MSGKNKRSVDPVSLEVLEATECFNVGTSWDRLEKQQPQCGFGLGGICCRNCSMGPCQVNPFGDEPKLGVCGVDGDTIAARNFLRMVAAGTSAHSDHGRGIAETFL
ncbi:MAG: carbon monoxide dehydrogenase, partial [Deltaproteobacteria bacterium]